MDQEQIELLTRVVSDNSNFDILIHHAYYHSLIVNPNILNRMWTNYLHRSHDNKYDLIRDFYERALYKLDWDVKMGRGKELYIIYYYKQFIIEPLKNYNAVRGIA
jgi:hypothetical protein